jgi:peptidoglycan-associated lipoprotein
MRLIASLMISVPLVVGGCAKKVPYTAPVNPAPAFADGTAPPSPPPPPAVAEPGARVLMTEEELFARKSLDELNAERPLAEVLFDLDDASISDDARAVLQKNADWMRRWSSTRVAIEGHCDERGSSEYNLALGERRGAAVKMYLVSLGIASERLDVVSKGKEAPVCTQSNESCWQQNRRGHPIITAK